MGVYQIELNGEMYIGSTIARFSTRWGKHLYDLRRGIHNNLHLQNAFNKYGEDALRFSVIETVETPGEVIALEQHYIDTLKPGYNICQTAGSSPMLGRKHTGEAKRKISVGNLGKVMSEEARRKIGEANKGKVRSEETRKIMSIARKGKPAHNKGKPVPEEQKRKISEGLKGRIISEETRRKISEAQKGKPRNRPAHNKGKPMSEEQKQKLSESLKLYYHNQNK